MTYWRRLQLTKVLRELYKIWWERLDVRFANMMLTRITNSGRSTDTPPPYTPHNFGIDPVWFEKFKDHPDLQILLRTWGQFEDPPGFGANSDLDLTPPSRTSGSSPGPSNLSGAPAAAI